MNEILDQLVPGEQGLHLGQALLQIVAIGQLVVFAHGAVPQKMHHFSTAGQAATWRITADFP
jgi:hypothetical protein